MTLSPCPYDPIKGGVQVKGFEEGVGGAGSAMTLSPCPYDPIKGGVQVPGFEEGVGEAGSTPPLPPIELRTGERF